MALYRVLEKENGTVFGSAVLPENPERYKKVNVFGGDSQPVTGVIEDWKVNDDATIDVRCSFEGESPVTTELLLVKVYDEDEIQRAIEEYAAHHEVSEDEVDVTRYTVEGDDAVIGFRLSLDSDNRSHGADEHYGWRGSF